VEAKDCSSVGLVQKINTDGTVTCAAGTASSGVTTYTAYLASNVSTGSSNVYADGPSLSLGAGTYFLSGTASIISNGTVAIAACKLWDGGSTLVASAPWYPPSAYGEGSITLTGMVTLSGITTMKISCAVGANGADLTILSALQYNGTPGNSSVLTALKLQ
jgi:hypothetical protein